MEDRRLLTVIMLQANSFADNDTRFTPSLPGPGDQITVKTLRDAVSEANYLSTVNPGEANTIDLQAGTYKLSQGRLNVTGNLTIQGATGTGNCGTTILQQVADRVFEVGLPALTVNFNNIKISSGTAVDNSAPARCPARPWRKAAASGPRAMRWRCRT